MTPHDLVIVGGGILGTAVAWQMAQAWPGADMVLLEKESHLAHHQSGRSSGVVHAGLYYLPNSLKARFCREGVIATLWFAQAYGVAFEQCGKLLVATSDVERQRMGALFTRARENGITAEWLDGVALRAREPAIVGEAALFSPTTGITDYAAITRTCARLFEDHRGEVRLGTRVRDLVEHEDGVTVVTDGAPIRTRFLIVCGGLQADRLAAMMNLADDFRTIPFRGEYYALGADRAGLVRHLIYPVPDPALPFLGVHLTRTVEGGVTLGPNAVFSLARESYDANRPSLRDLASSVSWGGFRRLAMRYPGAAVNEFRSSVSRTFYLQQCRRYCPELKPADLKPHPTGIRAQAIGRTGALIDDFLVRSTRRSLHICNAPSPAATSALPIGRHVVETANERLGLGLSLPPPVWRAV